MSGPGEFEDIDAPDERLGFSEVTVVVDYRHRSQHRPRLHIPDTQTRRKSNEIMTRGVVRHCSA
jgi:hypothetical protein